MDSGWRNKPSISIKVLLFSWSSGRRQLKQQQKLTILSKSKLNRKKISLMFCNSEILVLSIELSQAQFKWIFKVLLLSSHLLNSRHPVRKSKFGTYTVTGLIFSSWRRGRPGLGWGFELKAFFGSNAVPQGYHC